MRSRLLVLLLLALPALVFPRYKPWYNFYNFSYGAKARSMGNAFVAVADDLSASFWNPAGLATRRIPEFYLSYKTTTQWYEYDLQAREIANDIRLYNFFFRSRLNQIDYFSISAPAALLQRPWTFALSYYRYIPYGFKGAAEERITSLNNRFPPQVTAVTFKGSEGMDVLAFSAATSLVKDLYLGATLQQFFSSGSLLRETANPDGAYHSQFTEKLQGRNVILGALFEPFPALRLGFTWHSGLKADFFSTRLFWRLNDQGERISQTEESCEARAVVPEQYSAGALLRPAPWLDISGEYSRLDWQKATIDGYFNAEGTLPFPQKGDWPTGQQQSRNLRFGLEARVPFRTWQLSLRGGWSLERQLYADNAGESVSIKGYAAGIGCDLIRNLLLEMTYQRQVAGWSERGLYSQAPDVGTHFRANVFFLALTYRFGHIFKE
jgi:long-subunit fatty acid transport protein